ncbi:MAG: DUF2203 family protein [Pirellulales bacterium]
MSDRLHQGRKVFSVESANAMLPLVKAITVDLVELSREVIERRERLAYLSAGRDVDTHNPYGEELAQMEEELEKDSRRLHGYVKELRDLGVEPKNGPEGLVDFPTMMAGRLVHLCWKLGETEVLYWHEIEDGYRGRQLLTAGTAMAHGGDADAGVSFE